MKEMAKRIRAAFRDVAFTYRMGAGFAGDVNRTHPVSIEPALNCVATPCTLYGQGVLYDTAGATNTYRPFAAGDAGVTIVNGAVVRPFPLQAPAGSTNAQQGLTSAANQPAVPTAGPIDVMTDGYIMGQLNPGQANPTKGQFAMIQTAVTGITGGNNLVQGQWMTAATVAVATLANARYNGPADANGVVEIHIFSN